jgi:hypothetical protein
LSQRLVELARENDDVHDRTRIWYLHTYYSNPHRELTREIAELTIKIAELEGKNKELAEKNVALEGRIAELKRIVQRLLEQIGSQTNEEE